MNPLEGFFLSGQTHVGEVTAVPYQAVNTWLLYSSFEGSKSRVKQRDRDLGGRPVRMSGDDWHHSFGVAPSHFPFQH